MPTDEGRRAYHRVVEDLKNRTFYRDPYAHEFLEAGNLDAWIDDLVRAVDAGTYVPGPSPSIEVAKSNFHVRPGVLLSLEDQFAYQLLAMRAAEVIAPTIEWSARTKRFSHRLASATSKVWFRDIFTGWKNFTRVSLGKLRGKNSSATHVLVTDITAFYENIDIGRLVQELRAEGVPEPVTRMLGVLWNKWCGVRRRGIPQGLSTSDFFAEFYMNAVDQALSAQGLDHIRYSDDIRIFVTSETAGRLALQVLERVLRSRGLNPQSSKTRVRNADEAVRAFNQVPEALRKISTAMAAELKIARIVAGGYVDPAELIRLLRVDSNNPPSDVVERAWTGFIDGEFGEFDSTVFHYLIARLGDIGSGAAQDYCLSIVQTRPEETLAVVRYLTRIGSNILGSTLDRLAALIEDEQRLLFVHQRYLLLQWFLEQKHRHYALLQHARLHLTGAQRTILLPYWIAYVGLFSNEPGDFSRLDLALSNETDSVLRASYLYALRRGPVVDRDLIYSRCRGESALVDGAIKLARSASNVRPS